MRRWAGRIATVLGTVCYVVCGILGFIVSLAIVSQSTGFWGFVIAFALFPVTFVAAPWYALFHWGTWIPLLINYGGFASAWLLRLIGEMLNPSTLNS
jgi:hypothetical protein